MTPARAFGAVFGRARYAGRIEQRGVIGMRSELTGYAVLALLLLAASGQAASIADVAQAAAILSQEVGRPVRVQFMRWDEHGWDTYGPAHIGECRVAADEDGNMTAYQYHGWQHHWSLIETSQQLAAGTPAAEWPPNSPGTGPQPAD